jgi:hypothetical protein
LCFLAAFSNFIMLTIQNHPRDPDDSPIHGGNIGSMGSGKCYPSRSRLLNT